MADDEVATRAPESDAAQQEQQVASPINSQDTPAQSGAAMDHCTTDRPMPSSSVEPQGHISALDSIPTYITKPASYPQTPAKLLLFLTGGTGIHSPNNQAQADAFAAHNFVVVAPDQFNGDPAPDTGAALETTDLDPSLLAQLKLRTAEAVKSFRIDMWLARHTPETVLPILHRVLAAARAEFADCVAHGQGVYAVGYCFGGKYALQLGAPPPTSTPPTPAAADSDTTYKPAAAPAIRAAALAHATLVTPEDVAGCRVPVSMACVAADALFPDAVREQGRAALELNAVEHEVVLYDGCPHGFAVVGDYADERIRGRQAEAFKQMVAWLEGH